MATFLIPIVLAQVAAVPPDATDILRSGDIKPNIALLLDASGSMRDLPLIATNCTWWAGLYNSGNTSMTKNHVMRAALVGCRSADDGILDRWADKVNFSMFKFGYATDSAARIADFGSNLATLEAAAVSVPASSNTPMTKALKTTAQYFGTYFNNTNTVGCRPNFMLLLSDGEPNGTGQTFNFNCAVTGDPLQSLTVGAYEPERGAAYCASHKDMMCNVTGNQPIRTYTIAFGAPGSFSPTTMQNIAQSGQGEYYYASDLAQLDESFERIISSMAARAAVFYATPHIQHDGLFSNNVVYTSSFKPVEDGPWYGTVKKHCIEPTKLANGRYDTSDLRCIFKAASDGKTLVTNPWAVDVWTATSTTAATQGGTGGVIGTLIGAPGSFPTSNFRPRNILTWKHNGNYVAVQPNTWGKNDSWTSESSHAKLLNLLHGYTYDAYSNGDPVQVGTWPQGDQVNAPIVVLRYGTSCETTGSCYTVVGANDGMLHFFDTGSGAETAAVVPADLWKPHGYNNFVIRDLPRQPDTDANHRYYVDGGMVVAHVDSNGDGEIQSSEAAYLIFGLGRGGSAYYLMPASSFNGSPTNSNNPIRPLLPTPGTPFEQLRDTWATPWIGQANFGSGVKAVAVFPSGHIPQFDEPTYPTPALAPLRFEYDKHEHNKGCAAVAGDNGRPASDCQMWSGSGYTDPAPQDFTIGPWAMPNAFAYRLRFTHLDMQPADKVQLLDGQGRIVEVLPAGGGDDYVTSWVYDSKFQVRVITDGTFSAANAGFQIGQIEYYERSGGGTGNHYPTVFAVDLAKWNSNSPKDFADSADGGGLLLRVTKRCNGGGSGICIDETTDTDLANMSCPISSDISAYSIGGLLDSLYWGDECGQIWKAYKTGTGASQVWHAKRLLQTNTLGTTSIADQTISRGQSKDFRKIFRKLDLVPSSCPGRRVLGIYFGTGNVQRAGALDALTNSALNNGRDVVGVVWDAPDLATNLSLSDLTDVTTTSKINAKTTYAAGKRGWYFNLAQNERMLRDPLVFEGTAYFKTYRPTTSPAECVRSIGIDAAYAVDNCSAEASVDGNNDGTKSIAERQAWTGVTDVGSNLLLVTPRDSAAIVSVANLNTEERASITTGKRYRVPKVFSWREPRLP